MITLRTRDSKYALGLALIACLLLGGGTARSLAIDTALQIFVIICSTYAIVRIKESSSLSKEGVTLFIAVVILGIFQLLPLPISFLSAFRPDVFIPYVPGLNLPSTTATVSLSASRTLQSIVFVLVPIYYFIALSKLSQSDLIGLIPYYMIGIICNLIAAIIQYSMTTGAQLNDLLGYQVMVGMFANVNHFSTIMFSSIPLVIYLIIFMGSRALAVLILLLILIVLLTAGSRAGILIGLAITAASFTMLIWRNRVNNLLIIPLMLGAMLYLYGTIAHVGAQDIDSEYGRRYFAYTTLDGISENWVLGIGFGAFDIIFPHYETLDSLNAYFVNHAHNDYLEIVFEGGIIALLFLSAYILIFVRQAYRIINLPLQLLAMLSIITILVHSTVDYPLRTMAVAMIFAFLNALLFVKKR
ncbi:O-antigen ligase family protein [Pseudochrobactrum kiredjianiae]|uniref:O-antigen ligase family protein n=1 Tax=Pseudochrobactrum kiredjianiae TaxID=386305 RepID=A0ABW3V1V1_9HYPH|nr:O-antigen ligase family protein [Pseudochrobactrum kiredjianiae]MDM7853220.1 O-antigen ligase family protein [Pseudochrobactrum kiredjianiae]